MGVRGGGPYCTVCCVFRDNWKILWYIKRQRKMTPIGERERERERRIQKWLASLSSWCSFNGNNINILFFYYFRERERKQNSEQQNEKGNVQHKKLQELGTNYPRPIDQSLATTHQREKSQARNDDRLIIRNPKIKKRKEHNSDQNSTRKAFNITTIHTHGRT